ncbi:hypothetical protein SCHPADRAFT_905287 [Schizopora paradoxa]|uniref:F-box domain-containing protein n=1 Tax=Schizopora paradoxa TaxID=27342 RepID=A0A0H2RK53_9AGAM|nr:hypothetical protein SCHPADRAFT_905287 [Schizopora paradoxa]
MDFESDGVPLNVLFERWIQALQSLVEMDARIYKGKVVLFGAPTLDDTGNTGGFAFDEMPSSEVDAKIREIREFCDGFKPIFDDLSDMDRTLDYVRNALEELRSEANRLTVAQGLASLPDEVLSNIFILAQRSEKKGRAEFSIALSHVCRRFREISIGTPSLWNSVALMMPKEMTLTFLQRSGEVRLQVTASDSWTGSRGAPAHLDHDFFRAISHHMDRIAWLNVKVFLLPPEHSPSIRVLLSMLRHAHQADNCFPGLEELRIEYPRLSLQTEHCPVDSLLQNHVELPSLRTVNISSKGHFPAVYFSNIMTTIVVELLDGFEKLGLQGLLFLLQTSQSLNDITLVFSLREFGSGAGTFEITAEHGFEAPSVTSFVLITKHSSMFNDPTFKAFIRSCCFPNVSCLYIEAQCGRSMRLFEYDPSVIVGRSDCTQFIEDIFVGRASYPALLAFEIELTTSGHPLDHFPYFKIPFPKYMPNLEHFGIRAGTLSKICNPDLPALRTLRVEGCRLEDVAWLRKFIDKMVASGMDEHFESLRVSCNERVIREIHNIINLPKSKIDEKIILWDESHSSSPSLDFYEDVSLAEEIDDAFVPKARMGRRFIS